MLHFHEIFFEEVDDFRVIHLAKPFRGISFQISVSYLTLDRCVLHFAERFKTFLLQQLKIFALVSLKQIPLSP